MNDHFEEQEFGLRNLSSFKISIPQSIIVALIILVCMQFIGAFINLPSMFWTPGYQITFPLSFAVGSLLAMWALFRYLKTDWNTIKAHIMQPSSMAVIVLSILMYVFSMPFAEFLVSIVPTEGILWLEQLYKALTESFELFVDYKIAGFITICMLAPIFEEILFRGILLRGMLQYGISPITAIVVSSLLFGIAHLNPWQFLGAGLLGAIFGFIYYRTRALWICMLLHALNNTISFIMMLKYESMDESLTDSENYTAIIVCFSVAVVIGWTIYKLTQNKPKWN